MNSAATHIFRLVVMCSLALILAYQIEQVKVSRQIENHLWEQNEMFQMEEVAPEVIQLLPAHHNESTVAYGECSNQFDRCFDRCVVLEDDEWLLRDCIAKCKDDYKECVKDKIDSSSYESYDLAVTASFQESFKRDSHWCESAYESPEVRELCITLDLHMEESASHWAALYKAWRQRPQEIQPRRFDQ